MTVARHMAGTDQRRYHGLLALLRDPEECLNLLEQEPIIQAVCTLQNQLADPLYCYVEVRRRLLQAGLRQRETAIYLANIWAGYRQSGILPELNQPHGQLLETVDILRELNYVNGYEKFELLAMSGNYYLFLMAFFEGYFKEMDALSGKPALAYYEAFTRIAFRAARDHGLSEEFQLWSVYNDLCERFSEVRSALAGLS